MKEDAGLQTADGGWAVESGECQYSQYNWR